MSKFLTELKRAEEAFQSIAFDSSQLATDPEALQTFLSRQSTDGIEDLKSQIETLKAENATLKESLVGSASGDVAAADELLEETTAQLEKAEQELADLKDKNEVLRSLNDSGADYLAAFHTALLDSGIKLETTEPNAEEIASAIARKIQTATSEKLAAHGFKGLIEDEHASAADDTNSDPYAGLSGISKTAAAIKARRSSAK